MKRIFLIFILILMITLSFGSSFSSFHTAPISTTDLAVAGLSLTTPRDKTIAPMVAEPGHLEQSRYDNNNNKLHDYLQNFNSGEVTSGHALYVHYEYLPTNQDVRNLNNIGVEVNYKSKYVNVIQTGEVSVSALPKICNLPGVTFIEPIPNVKPLLDVSARAIKARESTEYSPDTAWDLGYLGYGINIAIIDGGVDDGHPSLQGKFIAGVDFTGPAGAAKPKDGSYNPDDINGHGTALAGIALGTGDIDEFYRGVAPEARLVDIKGVSGASNHLMEAFDWCLDNQYSDWNGNGVDDFDGIDVISISITVGEGSNGMGVLSQMVNNLADAGIVVAAAGGNDGPFNNGFDEIAAADNAITVGNLDDWETIDRSDDEVYPSSNVGPRHDDGDENPYDELKPDVVAPGTSIMAPQHAVVGQSGEGYSPITGTSASAPHVAGICALMLQANSDLRPRDIHKILHETAEAMGQPDEPELSDKYNYASGFGSIDAFEAVSMALDYQSTNSAPVISSLEAYPKFVEPDGETTITTRASDPDGDGMNYEYTTTGGAILGTGAEVTWVAPTAEGNYDITVVVNDSELYSTPATVSVTVEINPGNHAPVIDRVDVDPEVVEPGGSANINITASDPDEDELVYDYSPSGGRIVGTGQKVVWVAPESNGVYTIGITVTDGMLSTDVDVKITVEGGAENQPPEIEGFTSDKTRVEVDSIVQLYVVASDPEMDKLDYFYIVSDGELQGTGPNVAWRAPKNPGLFKIEVTVSDSFGLSDTKDLLIEVFQPNVPPEIKLTRSFPGKVDNDGTVEVLLTVEVEDENGLGDISKVVIDLTAIFGPENQKMYDNGKFGDQAEFDGVYSVSYLVPEGVATGRKVLPVSAQDYSTETVTGNLVVNITGTSGVDENKGFFEEHLGVPGFEGEIIIVALMIIVVLMSSRARGRKKS